MRATGPIPGREAVAKIEIGHTTISRRLAMGMTATFLSVVYLVPIVQLAYDQLAPASAGVPSAAAAVGSPAGLRTNPAAHPEQGMSILVARFIANREAARTAAPGFLRQVTAVNRTLLEWITEFEQYLDDRSLIGQIARPPTQYMLTRWLNLGNEQAYCGAYPWLFYRPGIDALVGPGFLEPAQLKRRASQASELKAAAEPDPVRAITDFHRQLSARGIGLIVLPTPDKATVHPERFASQRKGGRQPVFNPSHAPFLRELERAGITVVDVSQDLIDRTHRTGREQYLATDTHWRPEAMRVAAERVKVAVEPHLSAASTSTRYERHPVDIQNVGDVAAMLNLPPGQQLYLPERVQIDQVRTSDGQLWRPEASADVLLLGDSFSNIYSLASLGWGEAAGLVEQLSVLLQRPIDRIVRNDAGAFSTREMLAQELARGRDRLRGKRVVVWQFAARELAIGDWKLIDLSPEDIGSRESVDARARFVRPAPREEWRVRAIVRAAAPVPRPGTVPYRDHIMAVHLMLTPSPQPSPPPGEREAEGRVRGPNVMGAEAHAYMLSMRDNVWTPAARLRPGDEVDLRLRSWDDVAAEYERINRTELDDDRVRLQPPAWGELTGR